MATDMPSSMETVTLLLMNGDSETSCALLRYPFRVPASPGANTVSLRTPTVSRGSLDLKGTLQYLTETYVLARG